MRLVTLACFVQLSLLVATATASVNFISAELDNELRPLGTFTSHFSLHEVDNRFAGLGILMRRDIEDAITTTITSSEITMLEDGTYRSNGPGFEIHRTLGFDHSFHVAFEVVGEPATIELFHRSSVYSGFLGESNVILANADNGQWISMAENGRHDVFRQVFNTPDELTSGSPIAVPLIPGTYELKIRNRDARFDLGSSNTFTLPATIDAGLRFLQEPEPIPEPTSMAIWMLLILVSVRRVPKGSSPA